MSLCHGNRLDSEPASEDRNLEGSITYPTMKVRFWPVSGLFSLNVRKLPTRYWPQKCFFLSQSRSTELLSHLAIYRRKKWDKS